MLRLLLFISPGRNNDLYSIQQWGGPTTGYQRYKKEALKDIKNYYEHEGEIGSLFKDIPSQEWSFVFYQWANAVAPKPYFDRTPEQQGNFVYVNQKFLDYFKLNPEIAYECLKQDFFVKDRMRGDERRVWNTSSDTTNKYDLELLINTVESLTQDVSLTHRKRTNLNDLKKRLESALDNQRHQEKERERQRTVGANRAN